MKIPSRCALVFVLMIAGAAEAGKPDGATCHVGRSCSSRVCARVHPTDKFGVCCSPQSCPALGAECGTIDNGCGAPIDCGSCDPASECTGNICVPIPTTTTSTTSTTTTTTTTLPGFCGCGAPAGVASRDADCPCTSSLDCCSGICRSSDQTCGDPTSIPNTTMGSCCEAATTGCGCSAAAGQSARETDCPCVSNLDCCSGICRGDGTCGTPTSIYNDPAPPCCSNFQCSCESRAGESARPAGCGCASNLDCCSGICRSSDNTCAPPSSIPNDAAADCDRV